MMTANLTPKQFDEGLIAFRPSLMGMAMRWLRNTDDAQDAVQEVVLKALANRNSFSGDAGNQHAWLTTIMRNYLHTSHRRNKRVVYTDDDRYADQLPAKSDPFTSLCAKEAVEIVSSLPPSRRSILFGHAVGMSYDEIAREHNLAEGTVKSRLFRTRAAIKHFHPA